MLVSTRLKPWLKEFVLSRYDEPISLRKDSIIRHIITPLISIAPKGYKHPEIVPSESLMINVTHNHVIRPAKPSSKFYIPTDNQIVFEGALNRLFKRELYTYVLANIEIYNEFRYSNLKGSISKFCDENSITLDNTLYETLKKGFNRYFNNLHEEIRSDPDYKKIALRQLSQGAILT